MKKIGTIFLVSLFCWSGAQAESGKDPNIYLGLGLSSLALDNDRVPGLPTSSPGHSSKIGSIILGYQFNPAWSADISFGTDLGGEANTDVFALNGYYFFGQKKWRPYVNAGFSSFDVDEELAVDDNTTEFQLGVGISGDLSHNVELRASYQQYFTTSGDSYNDKAIGAALIYHFRKPMQVAAAEAEPAPAPVAPAPVELERVELIVQFGFDSPEVTGAHSAQFEAIARALRENPDIDLSIEGHTCWIGPEEYNQTLSERRARAVADKFVNEYGVDAGRVSSVGFGESRPVADNNTETGRRANRRAIAVILKPVAQ